MGKETSIAWCHSTFNAWRGCAKVSAGCKNCYAEAMDRRGLWGTDRAWGPTASRIPASDMSWKLLRSLERTAKKTGDRQRVFCGSMCDVGEDHPDTVAPRARLVAEIERAVGVDFLLLSKRPENFARLFKWSRPDGVELAPPMWAWLGTSVEDQAATSRIGALLRCRAWIRFLSVEPLLGPVDLGLDRGLRCETCDGTGNVGGCLDCDGRGERRIRWVIVGGESGASARGCDLNWIADVVHQCRVNRVPCFVKQLGSKPFVTLDGQTYSRGTTGKGEDPKLWPLGFFLFDDIEKRTPLRQLPGYRVEGAS